MGLPNRLQEDAAGRLGWRATRTQCVRGIGRQGRGGPRGQGPLIARARTIQPSTELVAASDGGTCTEFFPGRGRKRAVRTGPKPPRAQEWKERWTPGPCTFLGRGNGKSRRLRALIPHGRRNGRSVPAPRNRKPPQRVSSSPDARGSSSSRRNR